MVELPTAESGLCHWGLWILSDDPEADPTGGKFMQNLRLEH